MAERDEVERSANSTDGLSIYGYPSCPFCRRVLDAVKALGLEIPLRDILQDETHQRALVEAMGRSTVPVLLIEGEAGGDRWLPESADIVRYLNEQFSTTA